MQPKRVKKTNPKRSKAKGNSYELEIANLIKARFIPKSVDPTIAKNLVHRTGLSGGRTERGDIIIQPPLLGYFKWFFECRNRESWSWANFFKDPENSVLVKWFLNDAVDKCHPYAGVHERWPLLVFTKTYEPNYYMAFMRDVCVYEEFKWHTEVKLPKTDENVMVGEHRLIVGLFSDLLTHYEPPDPIIFEGLVFA